jgi:hypothetical protein
MYFRRIIKSEKNRKVKKKCNQSADCSTYNKKNNQKNFLSIVKKNVLRIRKKTFYS